jgi:mRNA interferase HigB
MRLVAIKHLRTFWESHPDVEQPLKEWANSVSKSRWTSPMDIKAQFRSASILKGRRVVFNIKGNQYRVVVAIAFVAGVVYIKFVGTHAEYDQINASSIQSEAPHD